MFDLHLSFDEEEVELLSPGKATSSTKLFNQNFDDSFTIDSLQPGMMPPGLLYTNELHTLLVYERPPTLKTVAFCAAKKYATDGQPITKYVLAVPWQVYVAEYELNGNLVALQMYYADSEIQSISLDGVSLYIQPKSGAYLLAPPLPNIYESMQFCLDMGIAAPQYQSLETRMAVIHNLVWESVFNLDLTYGPDGLIHNLRKNNVKIQAGYYSDLFKYLEGLTISDVVYGLENGPLFVQKPNEVSLASNHKSSTQLYNSLFGVVPLLV